MLVDEPGEAAIHGQVVDIFPAGALSPVRVDHDGRRITRICGYDPVSQRTIAELPEITLDAASEFLAAPDPCGEGEADPDDREKSPWRSRNYASLETLFEYMPGAVVRSCPPNRRARLAVVRAGSRSLREQPPVAVDYSRRGAAGHRAPLLFGAGVAGAAATARGAAVDRGG